MTGTPREEAARPSWAPEFTSDFSGVHVSLFLFLMTKFLWSVPLGFTASDYPFGILNHCIILSIGNVTTFYL